MTRYEIMDHTADLGAVFFGTGPEDVLRNAALGLVDLMVERRPAKGRETMTIEVEALDWPDLLVCWLGELVYIFHVRGRVVTDVRFERVSEQGLKAQVDLAEFDLEAHEIKHDIKAVTYHQAEMGPAGEGWQGRIVFDL